jgi:hypothetical protein
MDRITTKRLLAVLTLALAVGCAKERVQPISGKVALQTFDGAVTAVRVVAPGGAPIVGRVGLDGSFSVKVPRGKHYHLELTGPSGASYLVFPRAAAPLGWTFDVRGRGQPFDLGMVRYVGNPLETTYTFVTRQKETLSSPDGGAEHEDCEDGKNAQTGATCVDDDDDDDDKGKAECDDDDGPDDDDCVNGANPKTGAPCTPPPAPGAAAVADHNLPPVMGSCEDDEDDKDDHEGHDD